MPEGRDVRAQSPPSPQGERGCCWWFSSRTSDLALFNFHYQVAGALDCKVDIAIEFQLVLVQTLDFSNFSPLWSWRREPLIFRWKLLWPVQVTQRSQNEAPLPAGVRAGPS